MNELKDMSGRSPSAQYVAEEHQVEGAAPLDHQPSIQSNIAATDITLAIAKDMDNLNEESYHGTAGEIDNVENEDANLTLMLMDSIQNAKETNATATLLEAPRWALSDVFGANFQPPLLLDNQLFVDPATSLPLSVLAQLDDETVLAAAHAATVETANNSKTALDPATDPVEAVAVAEAFDMFHQQSFSEAAPEEVDRFVAEHLTSLLQRESMTTNDQDFMKGMGITSASDRRLVEWEHAMAAMEEAVALFGQDAFTQCRLGEGSLLPTRVVAAVRPVHPIARATEAAASISDANSQVIDAALPSSEINTPQTKKPESWLVELPFLFPKRQALHIESAPYNPSSWLKKNALLPQNDASNVYTPQNVMRWANKGVNQYLSNARMVRWSDSSVSLHIGSDVFEVVNNNQGNMTFIGQAPTNDDGELAVSLLQNSQLSHLVRNESQLRTIIGALPFDRHVQLKTPGNRLNSVDYSLAAEQKKKNSAQARRDKELGLTVDPVPRVRQGQDLRKEAKDGLGALTTAERFLEMQRKNEERQLAKRRKAGEHISLAEIIEGDLRNLDLLLAASKAGELEEKAAQAEERERLHKAQRFGGNNPQQDKGNRLDNRFDDLVRSQKRGREDDEMHRDNEDVPAEEEDASDDEDEEARLGLLARMRILEVRFGVEKEKEDSLNALRACIKLLEQRKIGLELGLEKYVEFENQLE